ncbi:MAG TPA: glycosyltransferase [Thermoanaerobaculia bacterium]|nr:glycosyltransferase [Thermoanaerobaculia bacterium]
MKVLHVVPSYLPAWRHGGPIRSVHGLCKALVARGHEVTVYTTDTDLRGRVPIGTRVDRDGVAVWYFPVRGPRRLYWAPQLRSALRRRIDSFDVVHLHSVFLPPTATAAGVARHAGTPYLLAPRGMLVADLLRRRGRLRKTLWIRFVERRTLRHAAVLHATSELEGEEARALASELGIALPPVVVLPNGVDEEADHVRAVLQPAVAAALERQPLVLFLGRLSWKKGLDRLVAALPHAPGATLAIAGGDEEAIGPRLRELARRRGVSERVLFLGEVQGADRTALLHRAAVVALTSYSENFGNAALEAMAAGTPVLLTAEVGLAAEAGAAGAALVAAAEPTALGGALAALLADPARREAMGKRGRDLVAARYRWAPIAAAVERVYLDVLRPSLQTRRAVEVRA